MKIRASLASLLLLLFLFCGCSKIEETDPTFQTEDITPTLQTETSHPCTTPEETIPATEPVQAYVEVWREGESSRIPVEIVRGTVGPYTIAMDPEYFVFEPHETVDLFCYAGWPEENAVYYAVSSYEAPYDPLQYITDMRTQYEALYESWSAEETTIAGFPATAVYLTGYDQAPDYVRHIFLIDCGSARYLIETEFTMEMYEGLYAIMRALFDTLTPT